jgi:DNA-binding NarL/FixJ family response regulator
LADLVRGSDAVAVPVRSMAGLAGALPDVDRVIVDLTARAYDGIEAIALAHTAGRPILAVGQHDDADLRRRALAAGAERVRPYRVLFEDGPRQMARWLSGDPVAAATPSVPESPR